MNINGGLLGKAGPGKNLTIFFTKNIRENSLVFSRPRLPQHAYLEF